MYGYKVQSARLPSSLEPWIYLQEQADAKSCKDSDEKYMQLAPNEVDYSDYQ